MLIVSGYGIVTSLGLGQAANFQKLSEEQHGLSSIELIETIHASSFPFGEVKLNNQTLHDQLSKSPKEGFTRTTLLGMNALQEAWVQAQIEAHQPLRIGLFNATTVGGVSSPKNSTI